MWLVSSDQHYVCVINSFLLLHVAAVHSFSLLFRILFYEHAAIYLSPIDGHVGCCQFEAMVNNTAVNILYMSFGGKGTHFSWVNTQK